MKIPPNKISHKKWHCKSIVWFISHMSLKKGSWEPYQSIRKTYEDMKFTDEGQILKDFLLSSLTTFSKSIWCFCYRFLTFFFLMNVSFYVPSTNAQMNIPDVSVVKNHNHEICRIYHIKNQSRLFCRLSLLSHLELLHVFSPKMFYGMIIHRYADHMLLHTLALSLATLTIKRNKAFNK